MSPFFVIDFIYEVLVPHNIQRTSQYSPTINFKNQASIIDIILFLHSEHYLSLCKIRKLRCEIKHWGKKG